MEDDTLVRSSFSATVHAPIEKVDIPAWCFTLPDSEYQACSPAHFAVGATTTPEGRRMSINVEVIGGSLIVQHYVSVKKTDDGTCEFTNEVHSHATPELLDFLGRQGIPWDAFKTARQPISAAHIRQETPLFAKSIERHALRRR